MSKTIADSPASVDCRPGWAHYTQKCQCSFFQVHCCIKVSDKSQRGVDVLSDHNGPANIATIPTWWRTHQPMITHAHFLFYITLFFSVYHYKIHPVHQGWYPMHTLRNPGLWMHGKWRTFQQRSHSMWIAEMAEWKPQSIKVETE